MNPSPETSVRRMRWWMPVTIVALAAVFLTWLQLIETNFRPHKTAGIVILTLLFLALWFILFTGLPFLRRLALLGALLLVVAGAGFVVKKFTRIEGTFGGMGLPRLVWKWKPKTDAQLAGPDVSPIQTGVAAAATAGQDFPEFLGAGRSNAVPGIRLARDWHSQPPRELWRQPVGAGWSSFAIAGGRAVTQEQRGENELVVCYTLQEGRALWAHTNKVRFSEPLGGDGPRATPTISSNRVFALGATGILDCLDLASGRLLWSRDTLRALNIENLTWGKSASPLVFDEFIVVSGGEAGPLLLAFRADSGEPAWRGGTGRSSYASPVLAELAGRRQILSVNADSVTGHDPQTGSILWEHDWPGDFPKCSQPVAVAPDKVLISAGYSVGSALLQLAPAADGKFTAKEIWRGRNLKTQFTNVAIRDGHAYGLDEGILSCVDLATGTKKWKDGRYGQGQLLLVGDLLLIQSERGPVVLVEAKPDEFQEVARWPALKSKTWNTPALAGKYLLVRNDQEAVCLELPLAP